MHFRFMNSIVMLIGLAGFSRADVTIVRKPLKTGAAWEFGQVIHGMDRDEVVADVESAPFNRLGVSLTQSLLANDEFDMTVGVGGIFWNPFPNRSSAAFTVNTQFGPGITEATGIYHFGARERKDLYLQFGYFPVKYNQNASNLGEYLFRSGTYPGLVFTGGPGSWSFVNGAHYMAQGARLHWDAFDGALSQDFTLFFERDYSPMFDLTPSYLVNFKPGKVFEIGAGISYNHLIPMKPSQVRPKRDANHLVTFENLPANKAQYTVRNDNGVARLDTTRAEFAGGHLEGMWKDLEESNYTDAAGISVLTAKRYTNTLWRPGMPDSTRYLVTDSRPTDKVWFDRIGNRYLDADSVPATNENIWWDKSKQAFVVESQVTKGDPNFDSLGVKAYDRSDNNQYADGEYVYPRKDYYFTYQGLKMMMMASLDFKPWIGNPGFLGPDDLKIFGELAVLGVQNQPLFYTDIRKRAPLMFGINLPAFKLLDLLSLQFEYYNNPWPNDSRNFVFNLIPTYDLGGKQPDKFQPIHSDDWHWSVLAKRKWTYGMVYLQVASDYLRTNTYTSVPTFLPVTDRFKQWYYAARFEFGI